MLQENTEKWSRHTSLSCAACRLTHQPRIKCKLTFRSRHRKLEGVRGGVRGSSRREEEEGERRRQVIAVRVAAAAAAAAALYPETPAKAARCSPAIESAAPCRHIQSRTTLFIARCDSITHLIARFGNSILWTRTSPVLGDVSWSYKWGWQRRS